MSWTERIKVIGLIIALFFMTAFGLYGCLADAERKRDALEAKAQLKEALDQTIAEQKNRAEERTREHMEIIKRIERIEKMLGIKK